MTQRWSTNTCLRTLRPLKSKITAFRSHCANFPVYKDTTITARESTPVIPDDIDSDAGDEDNVGDWSLDLEEHVISYKKCKKSYKRRKVHTDPTYAETDIYAVEELASWNKKTSHLNEAIWTQLNDILETFKQLFDLHCDTEDCTSSEPSLRSLRVQSAFKVGVCIGKNDREIRNLQDQIHGKQELLELYEDRHVALHRKWVMLGHAMGCLISQTPLVDEILKDMVRWGTTRGLSGLILKTFVEESDCFELEKYDFLRECSSICHFVRLDEVVLKRISISLSDVSQVQIQILSEIIQRNHTHNYLECLSILAQRIDFRCSQLVESHALVETIQALKSEQVDTLEAISTFVHVIHPKNPATMQFLTQAFHSCKRGYRSLIPVLRIIKSFLTHAPLPKPVSPSQKIILRMIFKPEYKITPHFIRYALRAYHQQQRVQTKDTTQRRSKISAGDLI